MDIKVLWLIPARSGSKSIKDKNIKQLGGYPLYFYRYKSAARICDAKDIWLSTDSQKYIDLARSLGMYVPFKRPNYLAADDSSSEGVVLHAMEVAEQQGLKYDYIGLLEPTSPFVYHTDLEKALILLSKDNNATAIVACEESRPNSIFVQDENKYLSELASNIKLLSNLGRQKFKKQITPSGGFYICKWKCYKKEKTFYTSKTLSYMLPEECTLEIDEPIDWQWAEFLLSNNIVDINKL